MNKILIFLDIDGTLLDSNYRPNSNLAIEYIKKLSRKGFLFCLNSNRSIEDMIPLIKKFKINGPVIGENGVFYEYKGKKSKLFKAKLIKKDLTLSLNKISIKHKAHIIFADTVNFKWSGLKKYETSWVVNSFRKWTASIHVLTYGKKDINKADKLKRLLLKKMGDQYNITTSPMFCNVLINPKGTDKGTAIRKIRERVPNNFIYMIGDDSADLSASKVVDRFYSVGNAEMKLKSKSYYVARAKYTRGVAEILKKIEKESKSKQK